jgi:two-component system, sensor histidine kinase and response regulator
MEAAINSQELWERLDGDRELLSEILECFQQEYPAQIQVLREALQAKDAHRLERAAHSLKGALANLSAPEGRKLASEVEQLARAGELARADSLLPSLEEEISRVFEALHNLCKESSVENPGC